MAINFTINVPPLESGDRSEKLRSRTAEITAEAQQRLINGKK